MTCKLKATRGTVNVSKNHTAEFDLTDGDRSTVAKDVEPDPFDAWDKQQDQYHQQYASNSYNSYSPYAYGTSDLNYYGNFFNVPRLRNHVAALFCGRWLGSVHERRLGVLAGFRLWLGFRLSVGLDAVSLWNVGLSPHLWMGMAAGRDMGGMDGAEDDSSSDELCLAAAAVESRSRNSRSEPRPSANSTRQIV